MDCGHDDVTTVYEVYREGTVEKMTYDSLTEAGHKHVELHKESPEWRLCQIDKCNVCGREHRVCIKEFLA